jgi:hypothetical protein
VRRDEARFVRVMRRAVAAMHRSGGGDGVRKRGR